MVEVAEVVGEGIKVELDGTETGLAVVVGVWAIDRVVVPVIRFVVDDPRSVVEYGWVLVAGTVAKVLEGETSSIAVEPSLESD